MMVFLIAFVGAALIAVVLWKVLAASEGGEQVGRRPGGAPPTPPRVSGPDDDPEFLRQLDERARKPDDPPAA